MTTMFDNLPTSHALHGLINSLAPDWEGRAKLWRKYETDHQFRMLAYTVANRIAELAVADWNPGRGWEPEPTSTADCDCGIPLLGGTGCPCCGKWQRP